MPRLIRLLLCITLPEYRKLPRLNLCSQVPGSQIHLQFGNIKVRVLAKLGINIQQPSDRIMEKALFS